MKLEHKIILWQLSLLVSLQQQIFCEAFSPALVVSNNFHSTTQLFRQSDSKWDDLEDDEDDDIMASARPDMKYVPRNVKRQHQNFVAMRKAGGPEVSNDVYVPEPNSETFWFVGKVARVGDVTVEQAVARQWPLIVQHAATLRPIELYPNRAQLEVWVAPGDSEMDVAYNRPNVVFQKMKREGVEGAEKLKSSMVGFQGEVYEDGMGGGMGFRTLRTKDGLPAKPEIKGPETPGVNDITDEQYSDPKFRTPTDEELKALQQELKEKNMDISDLYEEQQRQVREAEES